MPTLHQFTDRPGYYIRGISNGKPIALKLTPEGEQYMLETLGLKSGSKFAGDTLKWLYKRQWAILLAELPPEMPVVSEVRPAGRKSNQGVVQIRLSSSDHVAVDQSAEDIVRSLTRIGTSIAGPIPLPVEIEQYIVRRDQQRMVYDLRLYQRLLRVRNPSRQAIDAMRDLEVPREVDLKIEMLS